MGWGSSHGGFSNSRGELAILLLASLAVVAALVLTVLDGATGALASYPPKTMFLLAIALVGTALALAIAFRAARRGGARPAVDEMAELRKNLLTAEAIIKAEPQVLVFWEQGQRRARDGAHAGRRRRACRSSMPSC